jgi:hypothetical protein
VNLGGEVALEIRDGPRWEAVLTSVEEAEAALEPPLADEELADGWTEDLRTSILADVRRVRDELSSHVDTGVVLEDWSGVDSIDAEGDALRVDAILNVDLVLGELERAERALRAARALLAELATRSSSSDEEHGFDDAARGELRARLEELCRVLAAGEYLSSVEMDPWADALRSFGFIRASARPGIQDDAAAKGYTRQRIEQFPPGRRWESVAIFDGWLCNVAWTDVLDDEPGVLLDGSDDEPSDDEDG